MQIDYQAVSAFLLVAINVYILLPYRRRLAAFIKKFLLASGSLKEVAGLYGVTYPTVRLRLDRLIQKIHLSEDTVADPYVALVKRLAVADKLDFDTAKLLIQSYKKTKGEDA